MNRAELVQAMTTALQDGGRTDELVAELVLLAEDYGAFLVERYARPPRRKLGRPATVRYWPLGGAS